MNSDNREAITLGADVGGKDAHAATNEHILELRKLLRGECQGPYSSIIKEFALVLRIDGSVQTWGKTGVEGVALQKKNSFATADIFVPREMWSASTASMFRRFLGAEVKIAIDKIVEYAEGRGVNVCESLRNDVAAAIEKFES